MAFFKKYNGTTNARLLRVERAIWVLIYGGLLSIVLGAFIDQQEAQDAGLFYNLGGLAVVAGVVLIYVRSRLREED
ncbi:MAG: hypothetical protein A3E00_12655 [Curvibacter sp. RIFCSPHIGHO2_12_FULL_63_18]|uniref:hypothetical protein n=1 Tax=Rhodoferax sp. TaxID=50421 RepID=UPI0008CB0967|nr:hypothetical protein [Rhodoferax sp.]OGO96909.1 MAG: hypothetical protein A2037_10850 [Curvibacter sp. GWA2_63_95]OGP01086.1 MAG: hypothetical protein A3E00_12655 [Curvibacter sp. RIFCSPHIGHO2_12_FULL_63_18]HCX80670.1 hypothetical protein [Rhodoferax sp.]